MKPKHIIIFDSDCLLCNRFVQLISNIDRKKILFFAKLSGNTSKQIINEHPRLKKVDSIIFYTNQSVYVKSSAVIMIFKSLGYPFKLFLIFKFFPLRLRDNLYDFVARNRFRVFGKVKKCKLIKHLVD